MRSAVQQGSLYPALHRLENRGLLAAEWKESETGATRNSLASPLPGRRQLQAETDNWARLAEAVGLILTVEGGAQ